MWSQEGSQPTYLMMDVVRMQQGDTNLGHMEAQMWLTRIGEKESQKKHKEVEPYYLGGMRHVNRLV
jgi:hypothetical protein